MAIYPEGLDGPEHVSDCDTIMSITNIPNIHQVQSATSSVPGFQTPNFAQTSAGSAEGPTSKPTLASRTLAQAQYDKQKHRLHITKSQQMKTNDIRQLNEKSK